MTDKNKKPNKHYAKASHPLMEAVVHELFRFENLEQAKERLKDYRDTYHLSREQPEQGAVPSVRLWVQDYAVEDSEREDGYCGHFAIITPKATDDGKYRLVATKDITPVQKHPRKKYKQHNHPGWTHPIMQVIKRNKVFEERETANDVLRQLHEEFPKVSVPGIDKLNVIVYERTKGQKGSPVKKYVLSVREHPEGGFVIHADHNKRALPPKRKKEEAKGHFTQMLQDRKKRKPIGGGN